MQDDDFISKTRRKRRMLDLQSVGVDLTRLSGEQLARIDMPEALREAVLDAKRFTKHEARRRQMQLIGRLMRAIDAAPIAAQLSALHAPTKRDTALFHLAEKWRSELIADPQALERFVQEFPAADPPTLRALTAAAAEERATSLPPKHYRKLFHAINALLQAHVGTNP